MTDLNDVINEITDDLRIRKFSQNLRGSAFQPAVLQQLGIDVECDCESKAIRHTLKGIGIQIWEVQVGKSGLLYYGLSLRDALVKAGVITEEGGGDQGTKKDGQGQRRRRKKS